MIFCPLYSGSSGNSIFIASDNAKILIDAGLSGKSIENALLKIGHKPNDIDAILVTHEHSDHIKGVGVLSRKYDIPIYANTLTWKAMLKSIGKIKEHNIKIIYDNYINIKDMDIVSYGISHDAADPYGYAVNCKNKKACVATDLGFMSDHIKDILKDSDLILLESNHDVEMLKFGPYPYDLKRRILSKVGHLSNDDCGMVIPDILNGKFKRIILGHLSKINNYPELAYETVTNSLRECGIKLNTDVSISMARRDQPSNYISF
ncbi:MULTISPECIES: MBL fold metallo-hydrolase [Clostridium]|jgi:phosphoribosyl 1,2-cyclic phosphodiesterase|uniref:Metallo-hydrolase YycJ n=3 Tax=Clostridium TaxID=1485 RepID=D8GJC0_CLOLD|nr:MULTISPECIES: MBL fold metallo-hydrolase [Clostridium]ADK17208.1 predicted metal dependent hydrolase [Clostridium ljungdahlii DSM 13528]AGY76247.1 MBL fold metallo-hydrolase [Clostridium autoethanogenum DSM 10061]ALU36409.1 Beta-lactamase domain protein [Clostridium autoethanogenum DSM 10061]OAA84615.1 putative metallo-hydrolase YycJ [Clostridium ljungdahlii DSM 13528]OVY49019.1 putative metallo-hydrolase YycJ [Clostridium autoethanogenum]